MSNIFIHNVFFNWEFMGKSESIGDTRKFSKESSVVFCENDRHDR